jgi:hypothetical protein
MKHPTLQKDDKMTMNEITAMMKPLIANKTSMISKEYHDVKMAQVTLAAEHGFVSYIKSQIHTMAGKAWTHENEAVKIMAMRLTLKMLDIYATVAPDDASKIKENFSATVMRHGVGAAKGATTGPEVAYSWLSRMEDADFDAAAYNA